MKYNLENRRRSALARRERDLVNWNEALKDEKAGRFLPTNEEKVKLFSNKIKTAEFEIARLKERISA